MKTIVVIFARFGPYHIARLEAAGNYFRERETQLVGVEIAKTDSTNLWQVDISQGKNFKRITLFPETNYHELDRGELENAVEKSLDTIDPIAVALPGWGFPEAKAGFKWGSRNNRSLILMSESNKEDLPRYWLKEQIKKQIVRKFDAALVGGSSHANYVNSLGMDHSKIFLGYDVVDNNYFETSAKEIHQNPEEYRNRFQLPQNYFLAAGRFVQRKNFLLLLKAFAQYRQKTQNPWDLVLCGHGSLLKEFELSCQEMNSKDSVFFPGPIQYLDLPAYYSLAKAFILPSIVEPWGLVVNEAMACTLPLVVSNRCGCIHELIEEGRNGFSFNPENITQLTELLVRFSSDKLDLKMMGSKSLEIIKNYSPKTFAEGLWDAFQTALE